MGEMPGLTRNRASRRRPEFQGALSSTAMASDHRLEATLTRVHADAGPAGRSASSWALPPDLLAEAVRRIRAVAWLYVFGFAVEGLLIPLLIPQGHAMFRDQHLLWVPAAISIADALLVVALLSSGRISARVKMWVGLAFEVLGSLGIASAEYHHITSPIIYGELGPGGFGLSWVGIWVLLFSVVVPVPPRLTLISAALSLAAVPIAYAAGVASGINLVLPAEVFFFSLVFPYFIVLVMAYTGSRVVYRLGTAIREAPRTARSIT